VSRFFQASILARPSRSYRTPLGTKAIVPTAEAIKAVNPTGASSASPLNAPNTIAQSETRPSAIQRIAFTLLCIYLISNLANDWSMRLFGQRAFLSLITGAALPIACLTAGTLLRGLRAPVGRWWLAFLVWAIVTIPFSFWPGGSFAVVRVFGEKHFPLFFYVAATTLTISQCRRLFNVLIFGAFTVVAACVFFGDQSGDRFVIPNSLFFDNSNDLALQLLIGAIFCCYLLLTGNVLGKAVGVVLFLMSMLYVFKTGSRGNFLSVVVCLITALIMIKRKTKLLALIAILLLTAPLFVSKSQWLRLVHIVWSPEVDETNGDVLSQMQRTEVAKSAIMLSLTHPLFGVGPGQFAQVIWENSLKAGRPVPSLGTHNTYLEISSEMGMPTLIFYLAALIGSLRMNLQLYRWAKNDSKLQETANMALCLVLALAAYSVSTIFHHVAYGRQFPILAGMSFALWTASAPRLSLSSSGKRFSTRPSPLQQQR
jgi:O-antigen ligase